MRSKGIFVTVVVVLAVIFTAFNWGALSTPLPINFLFFSALVPLGLFLIGSVVVLSLLFLLLSLFRRAGQLRQITHLENQNDHLRAQLDKRRMDEFTGLEERLTTKIDSIRSSIGEHTSQIETHERAQAERIEERVLLMRNELAADIAQVETSLRKSLPASSSSPKSSFSKPDVVVTDKEIKRVP